MTADSAETTDIIYFRQYFPDGSSSQVLSREFSLQPLNLERPVLSVQNTTERSARRITIESSGAASYLYSLHTNAGAAGAPEGSFPSTSGIISVQVPRGFDQSLYCTAWAVDQYGGLSEASEPVELDFDTLPPVQPSVSVSDRIVTLVGSGRMYYSIAESTIQQPRINSEYQQYTGPVSLNTDSPRIFYRIRAYAEDSNGNRSDLTEPVYRAYSTIEPSLPNFIGIQHNGIYSRETITLSANLENYPWTIRYTQARGENVPDAPTLESQEFSGNLHFSGIQGSSTDYRIKLRAFTDDGTGGRVYDLQFTIDLVPPQAPTVEGVTSGEHYRTDPNIIITPADTHDIIHTSLYRLTDGEMDPVWETRPYTEDFTVRGIENQEITYTLQILANDRAGNSIPEEVSLSFTIDKAPPNPPVFSGIPVSGLTNTDTEVRLSTEENGSIYYAVSRDGTFPDSIIESGTLYTGPFTVTGSTGSVTDVTIRAIAVDQAGNQCREFSEQELTIDKVFPSMPTISGIENGSAHNTPVTISVSTEDSSSVYYTYTTDNTHPPEPNPENGTLISESITFNPVEEREVFYSLRLASVDPAGNITEYSQTIRFTLDSRAPSAPYPEIIPASGRTNRSFPLRLTCDEENAQIYYTLTSDSTAPSQPTRESNAYQNQIILEGTQGSDTIYQFQAIAVDQAGNTSSVSDIFTITIDMTAPQLPEISGLEDNGIYRDNILVRIIPEAESDTVYYTISDDDSAPPDPLVTESAIYSNPLSFQVEENEVQDFSLRIAVEDNAGNTAASQLEYAFTIDKSAPEAPTLNSWTNDIYRTSNTVLTFEQNEDAQIYYEYAEDESAIPEITTESQQYSGSIPLSIAQGELSTFYLQAAAVDEAGNFSSLSPVYVITLDRRSVAAPSEPNIEYSSDQRLIHIYWPDRTSSDIYYRIQNRETAFSRFNELITLSASDYSAQTITLEYYSAENDENRSPIQTAEVSIPTPRVHIASGQIMVSHHSEESEVRISAEADTGIIRYEINTSDSAPNPVTPWSPVFEDTLTISGVNGEELSYTVSFELFTENGETVPDSEETIQFNIDRKLPAQPVITGVEDQGYYQAARTVSLSTDSGLVYYAVTEEEAHQPSPNEFDLYEGEITLGTEDFDFSSYTVWAYSIDNHGNRSAEISSWTFFIDKQIIYVSSEGNDLYTGTRSRPLATLHAALTRSQETGRNVIYLTTGRFELQQTLSISEDMRITGGFIPGSWEATEDEYTIIDTGEYFSDNRPLVSLSMGNLEIEKIYLTDSRQVSQLLINNSGGNLILEQSTLASAGNTISELLIQTRGTTSASRSTFYTEDQDQITMIRAEGGEVSISDSEFTALRMENTVVCLDAQDMDTLLIENSTFLPGSGENTQSLRIQNSRTVISDSVIATGEGTLNAIACSLDRADIRFNNCEFQGNNAARINTLLFAEDSDIFSVNSIYDCSASSGSIGLQLRSCSIDFQQNMFTSSGADEYIYPVKLNRTTGDFFTNIIDTPATGDSILIELQNSTVKLFSNNLIADAASRANRGIVIHGAQSYSELCNNIIARRQAVIGSAILLSEDVPEMDILSNNFSGYSLILHYFRQRLSNISASFDSVRGLNNSDTQPFGGHIHGNVSESFRSIFADPNEYTPASSSSGLNQGIDVSTRGGPQTDWIGNQRPNPNHGIRPAYDIGAFEYYED
ncbi:MAG: chitobiase/beta-hexosaminidase C-terminal domain-containing protein [Spirochaetia bacterium]